MSQRRYSKVTEAIHSQPWAIQPAMLAVIEEVVQLRISGSALTEEEIEARIAAAQNGPRQGPARSQGVAVIPVYGVISQRMNLMTAMSGGTSVEGLTRAVRGALADPDVGALVLDIDSPGGMVEGIAEIASEIRAARGQKPIVAVANAVMASAAYWIGSAADEVVATPSAQVGSIGVIGHHVETSKADEMAGETYTVITAGKGKANQSSHVPIDADGIAEMQALADGFYSLFVADVAAGRGVPKAKVTGEWQASVLGAKAAKAAGMVDRVDTLDATVARLGAKINRQATLAAAAGGPEDAHETIAAVLAGLPIHEQLALLNAEGDRVAAHYAKRAELRAKEGRALPADTEVQLSALRSLRTSQGDVDHPDLDTDQPEEADSPQAAKAIAPPFEILEAAVRGGYSLPAREVSIS